MQDQTATIQSNQDTINATDSWENRIQQASILMGLRAKDVERILSDYGIDKEPNGLESLSDEEITPFGDLRKIFCEDPLNSVKLPKLRMAMKVLRGSKEVRQQTEGGIDPEILILKEKFGIKIKLENVDPAELLQYYHADKPNHPVTMALKNRYGTKPVIIFKPDSKIVDIEATANYMADLEQGFKEQETIETDGVLVRIYKVGEVPNQLVEEDPLFIGQPLKRGRSTINRINWENIEEETRKFCRIIVERNDIDPNDRFQVRELIKLATNGIKELKEVYPEADLEYRERKDLDDLPKLRLTMQQANNKINNPFGINRRF